jgi:hypothetical protein
MWTTEQQRRDIRTRLGDYLTTREVARRIGLTEQGARHRMRVGLLPSVKVGQYWFTHRENVPSEEWY